MEYTSWTKNIKIEGVDRELEVDPQIDNQPRTHPEKFVVSLDYRYFGIMKYDGDHWDCSTSKPKESVDYIGQIIDSYYQLKH